MGNLKNIRDIVIIAAVVALAFGGLIWVSMPKDQNETASDSSARGQISAEENSFDFGTVSMASGNVSRVFKIKNLSPEAASITKLYTSCMCTTATLDIGDKKFGPFGMLGHGFIPKINAIIRPGEEAGIEVVFDPAAHGPAGVGPIERIVYIEQAGQKPLELTVRATVTP